MKDYFLFHCDQTISLSCRMYLCYGSLGRKLRIVVHEVTALLEILPYFL